MFKGAFSGYSSSDIDECKRFYADVLKLTITEQMGGFGFNLNGHQIFVYPKDDHAPASFTVLNFVVDDIDQTVDELAKNGVTFERYDNLPVGQDERGVLRGKDTGYGPNIAWFKDPSGNILAVVEE